MTTLETGKDKIQQICIALRKETLEPAKLEGERIIEEAQAQALRIKQNAEQEAERLITEAQKRIEQERNVFHSTLDQAGRQTLEALRQSVDSQFFNEGLDNALLEKMTDPGLIAKLINAVVIAIEKEGIQSNLEVTISKTVSSEQVAALLLDQVTKRLVNGEILLGSFKGGAKIKLVDQKMTLEVTQEALKETISHYVRKDFRKLLFGTGE